MTKYNLEEFKKWLEADPERKGNLSWGNDLVKDEQVLNAFIEGVDPYPSSGWAPYRQTVLEWKAEVDIRERERERERAQPKHQIKIQLC